MNKKYVQQIINVLDTKTNRTSDATRVKNFKVTQDDIDRYGMEDIISTLSYLETHLPRIVKVTWSYYAGKKRDVKSFSVNKAGVDDLFHVIGVKSSREQLDEMRIQVERAARQCPEDWLFEYYRERLDKLDRGTFLKDVDPEVDRALRAVVKNQEPVYERKFSEAFGDSKAFARQYKERVCT
ncbi:MAG: hypothetical protein J5973_10130, partial [Eubacterium sp.]|nr:hypothetical protein [Eubacterium sp.]